ncbi:kinase domain-containing protein [Aspergillus flavus]|uniref:non-specific serine/threonine protein kinase n=1 Tax=Aspergillus flavus TaxID=5059 RepID=A0A5N6GSJ5_ASPFL|nr:kinase domain-containing protein [Aspergillus flavus]
MSTFPPLRTDEMSRETEGSSESSITPGKIQYKLIEYQLVDKLGYGGYSTIWLARELRRARYVAVKPVTADTSAYTPGAGLLYSLGDSPVRLGKEIIPPLIDEFWVAGPNGKHKCIVTPPAWMGLFDAKEASTFGLFRPKLIRGAAFLHSESIVHSDLHLGNILVQFPDAIDRLSTVRGHIRRDGKPLSNGVSAHVFIPGWFGVPSDDLVFGEEKIILSDFGESFNPHKTPRFSSKTLPLLQPPEAIFSDEPLSFASGIWTLACTIWEISGQRPLFEASWPTADRVTAEQVEVLGILPPEWWGKWSRRLEWFNEKGELRPETSRSHDSIRRTWDQRFGYCIQQPRAEAGLEKMTEKEKSAFEDMLRSMLTFRPEERATAQEVLHSDWMKGWGEPALEELGYV